MHSIGWQKKASYEAGQQPASFFEAGLERASILHERPSHVSLTAAREARASSRGVGQLADDVVGPAVAVRAPPRVDLVIGEDGRHAQ